ncbi:MAG: nitroreductase family protein [Bacteroidales bacterium]
MKKSFFLELAKKRFSARSYKPDPVPEELLMQVLEAGRIAPSAVNYQPWIFYVANSPGALEKIYPLYHRSWFREAPAVIILCADHSQSWKRKDGKDHADIDVAIAADHMTLAAADLGLATCWICNFDKEKSIEVLNLPEHIEPVVFLSLGYPATEPDTVRHTAKRKPLKEIVNWL